jgi:hypothetical protein
VARITPEAIVAIAREAGLLNPRVIMRKLNTGRIAYVLKHGPVNTRAELALEQTVSLEAARVMIANVGS